MPYTLNPKPYFALNPKPRRMPLSMISDFTSESSESQSANSRLAA